MVTAGNHEMEFLPGEKGIGFMPYESRWRLPHEVSASGSKHHYSFDAAGGAVHVVMLGSYAKFGEGSEQHVWLRRDIGSC